MADRVLIGDIGGSSSRWAWVGPLGQWRPIEPWDGPLPGFNPLSDDGTALRERLLASDAAFDSADRVYVYAAGCGDPSRRQRMRDVLMALWPAEKIHVESDLMGAARGVFGYAPGRVLVLGTGMSAAYYDGTQLLHRFPSLGPLLGDEGSGADIGRCLVRDALYGRMPDTVRDHVFGADLPEKEAVLQGVYASGTPGRFLAGPVVRLQDVLDDHYVSSLLAARFRELALLLAPFFQRTPRVELRAVGSVAWGFREQLAEALADVGLELTAVERDPLRGLALHHG